MITAILVLATAGWWIGLAFDLLNDYLDITDLDSIPKPRPCIGTIMIITWWDISMPVGIILTCLVGIWFLITLLLNADQW